MPEEKSFVDRFFDSFEEVVDGIGSAYEGKTHDWKMEEILDGVGVENSIYRVSDGVRRFDSENKEHAEWLLQKLENS